MKTELLDELEEIMVNAILPTIRTMKEMTGIDTDERKMALSLLAKVGSRIAFGKDVYDKAIN